MSLHATAAGPQAMAHRGTSSSFDVGLVLVVACVVAAVDWYSPVSTSADRRKSATGLGIGDASRALIMSLRVMSADPQAMAHMGVLSMYVDELV